MGRMDDHDSLGGERVLVGDSSRTEASGLLGQLTCHFDKDGGRIATTGVLSSLMAYGPMWEGSDGLMGDDRGCPILVRCVSCPKGKSHDGPGSAATREPGVSGEALVRQAQLDQAISDGFL